MKSVTIIGGGLAGLTLGIGLRQRGVPVTLHEAGTYPRHRVCGEFISGRGQETLTRLGLHGLVTRAGAIPANTAAFFTKWDSTMTRPLPVAALCVSRHDLDAALAAAFTEQGGELRVNDRVRDRPGQPQTEPSVEGRVHATGRRIQQEVHQPRWIGLKIHARGVKLAADLEMHLSPRGYVGICRINGDRANICGLFRRDGSAKDDALPGREWLSGTPGSLLQRRMASARFDDKSFCAVAGLSLTPERAAAREKCSIGDAITMIPPVTGNGMSMAFESAELAIGPLTAWSQGTLSWNETQSQIATRCDQAFASRLTWAKWLQRAMFTPALQSPLFWLADRSDWFWRTAFEHTR